MSIGRSIKRRAKACVAPLIFLAMFGYFIRNAAEGDRGWDAQAQRQADLAAAQAQLARAQGDLKMWERRVYGLNRSHLDPDALDERIRRILGLSDPSDIILLYEDGKKLF